MTFGIIPRVTLTALLLASQLGESAPGKDKTAVDLGRYGPPATIREQSAPGRAGDRIEVVMEGDTSVVNIYRARGLGGAEVRRPKSGWPAAVVVRLHGFSDLESFKVNAGTAALDCELQRAEGRAPEQVCRMGNMRLDALQRTPHFFQVTLPNSMLTPEARTAELHWVDQWR